VAATLFAGFDAYTIAGVWLTQPQIADFGLYYSAARVGLAHGWTAMYDPGLYFPALHALGRSDWSPFLNPPYAAWLVLPVAWLPYPFAMAAWMAFTTAAFALVWWLSAPGDRAQRALHLALAIGLFPVAMAIYHGQTLLIVVLGVAGCVWLARRDRPWLAGLVLAAVIVKPQLAYLVPLTLLVAGRGRVVAAFIVTVCLLLAVAIAALGPGGVLIYLKTLTTVDVPYATAYLTALLGPGAARLAGLLAAVIACTAAWRWRDRYEVPVAAGLLASLLSTPYGNEYDLVVVLLAGWLVLRAQPAAWPLLLAGWPALEFINVVGPLPAVLFEIAFLVALAALPRPPAQVSAPGPVRSW
jgi:hypothetical protein